MNLIDALSHMASPARAAGVTGSWRALRMQLDPATGETVNVGVWFQPDGAAPVWRLLVNVAGLRCLYGADGAANAAFAIDQARTALARDATLPAGWTIALGAPRHARGENAAAVLDTLFQRVVPLGRHELQDEDRLDADDHRLSTGRLRRQVRELIKQRYRSKQTPGWWRDTPVQVATRDGHSAQLDLQVWAESGTAVGAVASITSAWYTSKFHRDSYLASGYRALVESRQIDAVRGARAGMYVLRPMNDSRFTEEQLRTIDNEIDSLHWTLQRFNIEVHAFDNEQSLTEEVLALA